MFIDIFNYFDMPSLGEHAYGRYIINGSIAILVFPVCLLKSMSSLSRFAILGFFSLLYVIILILIETPNFYSHFIQLYNIEWIHFDWNLIICYSICLFAFNCYTVVFTVREELVNPKRYRMRKVIIINGFSLFY